MASTNTSAPAMRLAERKDTRMSLGTALTYKFNRELSLKGEYRYDQLQLQLARRRITTPTSSWSG